LASLAFGREAPLEARSMAPLAEEAEGARVVLTLLAAADGRVQLVSPAVSVAPAGYAGSCEVDQE
jgi:predicted metallo-beta-lactamase superfamily hydrolase